MRKLKLDMMEKQKNTEIVRKGTEPEAFQIYLTMGVERSLAKVFDVLRENFGEKSVSVRTIEKWSSENKWVEQAEIFDQKQHDDIMKIALKKAVRSKSDILTICQVVLGQFAVDLKGEQVVMRKTDNRGNTTEEVKINRYHPSMSDVEKAYHIIKQEIGEGLPEWGAMKEINLTAIFQQIFANIGNKNNGEATTENMDVRTIE